MPTPSPFQLTLNFSEKNLELSARLKNISPKDQQYLKHWRQQARISLISPEGEISFEDSTANEEAPVEAYRIQLSQYAGLATSEEIILQQSQFQKHDGFYTLQWNRQVFKNILPGEYNAKLELHMLNEHYNDSTHQEEPLPEVWQGAVISPSVRVSLP